MVSEVAILGASGRIGQALCNFAEHKGMKSVPIEFDVYRTWSNEKEAKHSLKAAGLGANGLLICAAGIIDPQANKQDIEHINYKVALNACRAARDLGARAISLGTVLEKLIPQDAQNPYVASKFKLQNRAENEWLHLQLHTVYGGSPPAPFMFTGLMFAALQANRRFSMTPGQQLREYHQVDDEAEAIFVLSSQLEHGCFDVSHGNSIRLCDLAKGVFEHFERSDLLGIGDMQSPSIEAYEQVFYRQSLLGKLNFRDALPGVIEWLEAYL